MLKLSQRPGGPWQETGLPTEQIAGLPAEPASRWQSPLLVRCVCPDCGAHCHRRLGLDGAALPCEAGGRPCSVCGAGELMPLELRKPVPID